MQLKVIDVGIMHVYLMDKLFSIYFQVFPLIGLIQSLVLKQLFSS